MRIIPFTSLGEADLFVDAIYESSFDGQLGGEPLAKLLPGSGNMGGFRVSGRGEQKNWVVLFTTGEDRDWPDTLDLNTGQFVYYGDNKTPGHELHDTRAGGNKVLRHAFARLHADQDHRSGIAPFFVFKKHATAAGGTLLFAAMEILQYGVLYIFSRENALTLGYKETEMLGAPGIHLKVLAPAAYYEGYNLSWLEKGINSGLAKFLTQRNGFKMDFKFESLSFGLVLVCHFCDCYQHLGERIYGRTFGM